MLGSVNSRNPGVIWDASQLYGCYMGDSRGLDTTLNRDLSGIQNVLAPLVGVRYGGKSKRLPGIEVNRDVERRHLAGKNTKKRGSYQHRSYRRDPSADS